MDSAISYARSPDEWDQGVFDNDINLYANFDNPAWDKDPILFPHDPYPFVDPHNFDINTQYSHNAIVGFSPQTVNPHELIDFGALEPSISSNAGNTPVFSPMDPGSARTDVLHSPDFGNVDLQAFGHACGGAPIETDYAQVDMVPYPQTETLDGLSGLHSADKILFLGCDSMGGPQVGAHHEFVFDGSGEGSHTPGPDSSLCCQSCSKSFATKEQFTLHMRRHDLDFACPLPDCDSRHGAKKELHRHIWVHHREFALDNDVPEREEPCPRCGKFFRKDNLKRHLERARPCKSKSR